MTGIIYIIRNTINSKVYIGQTTMTLKERMNTHLKPSTVKLKGTYKLYNAMKKYRSANFYAEILEDNVPIDKLDEREIYWIEYFDSYKNGYNSTTGGDGRLINKIQDIKKIIERIEKGEHAKDIAAEFGVNEFTVRRALQKYDYHIYKKVNLEELALLSKEKTNKELADYYGVHPITITRALEKINCKKYRKKVPFRKDFDLEGFIRDYESQMPRDELCQKYNLSKTSMYRTYHRYKQEGVETIRKE